MGATPERPADAKKTDPTDQEPDDGSSSSSLEIQVLLDDIGGAPPEATRRQKILPFPDALPEAEPAGRFPSGASDARRHRILVVDPAPGNRNVLEERLGRDGYEVACAADGEQAFAMLAKESFDLILLELNLPKADGPAVLRKIKASPSTREIPVMVVSASYQLSAAVRCIEHGAADLMLKPLDPVIMRARVGACVQNKRLRDTEVEHMLLTRRVMDAAAAMESGNYAPGTLSSLAARGDDIGQLARVFDAMAAAVKGREERLQNKVQDLQRRIEEARRHEEPKPAGHGDELELVAGTRLGDRYEILSAVGSGGMGVVYQARDGQLDEIVAIKVLRRSLVSDKRVVEMFHSELRLARRLSHRNIVRMHDIGFRNDVYYLTMEYVEGITVRQLLNRHVRLGIPSTVAIAQQLSEALAVAHKHNVIHRDVKPQNLLLDGQGVLKVMDFGVAKLLEHTFVGEGAGMIVGSPGYVAPEALREEKVDGRADLYAMGVVLYECLTGEKPFHAKSLAATIEKILFEPPPLPVSHLNPDVPPVLSDLIGRLMARKADSRPRTAEEVANVLIHL
ncbi:MAG: protein kinase [Deltaproteobacteria bacterium]|nr:protein kinase [Deltaproteobacteria bacterium]